MQRLQVATDGGSGAAALAALLGADDDAALRALRGAPFLIRQLFL